MPEDYDYEEENGGARSFWSGTIAFGLVSLPVSLYTANRPRRVSLRMLDEDGTPLQRRYFCSRDEQELSRDDLVRGFEIEKEHYIEVDDDELEALAPEKSREIDLRRFVPLSDIDPMYFERAYFLVPDEGASKAYRLLAKTMETTGRAGIATFVMRGKEYLIAIISEGGILRAETLRFHDELRTPADVGLPELDKAAKDDVRQIRKSIDKLASNQLERRELTDDYSAQLLSLVERKLQSDQDVVHAPEIAEEEETGAEVIDLMEVLKQSLAASTPEPAESTAPEKSRTRPRARKKTEPSKPKRAAAAKHTPTKRSREPAIDPDTSKAELYELARELDIQGRSQMSKQDLLRAIEQAR
ncbi:non-homologous end joining protein Ku [Gilvimarinus sp. F26214L]|uniref:non-homologous end joining protein Ku n=1 Tax=Gilvimarinus sp. DZF01 TaxID=3461371 RepID=UPI0040455280